MHMIVTHGTYTERGYIRGVDIYYEDTHRGNIQLEGKYTWRE